jgi:hypothetical protein
MVHILVPFTAVTEVERTLRASKDKGAPMRLDRTIAINAHVMWTTALDGRTITSLFQRNYQPGSSAKGFGWR